MTAEDKDWRQEDQLRGYLYSQKRGGTKVLSALSGGGERSRLKKSIQGTFELGDQAGGIWLLR